MLSTVVTTTGAGFFWHVSFVSQSSGEAMRRLSGVFNHPLDLLNGLPFAFTILLILLAHEMGHYLTCRYYGIDATLPYLIPAPPPFNPFGTFGAVIKIRSRFPDRRQLFDVGIAGPLAGFIFIIPSLIVGLQLSIPFSSTDPSQGTLEFGEPLIFHLAAMAFFPGEAGAPISLHPIGWAAWFGMLATCINLLPIGQLDGGHIVYGLFGARIHRIISFVAFGALVGISFYSWPMLGYLLFALILIFIGFRHPRPGAEFPRLGRGRVLLALIGLIIFVLTFMPVP
ncbi:site-2 protease family protein, partial [bacterium]|nr:site-2 protease family protein [bacterium]